MATFERELRRVSFLNSVFLSLLGGLRLFPDVIVRLSIAILYGGLGVVRLLCTIDFAGLFTLPLHRGICLGQLSLGPDGLGTFTLLVAVGRFFVKRGCRCRFAFGFLLFRRSVLLQRLDGILTTLN